MRMQQADGLRVLLYSHDSFGLGHFRRTSSIAHAIAAAVPGASQLCVTGSPRPDLFPLPAGADYVKLPSVTKSAAGDYVSQGLESGLVDLVHVRAQTIAAVARSYRPHLILVDHTPMGIGGELLPMLEQQSARGQDVCIVLGLRDILDDPQRAHYELTQPRVQHVLTRHYDHVLVYGHSFVCDLAREYDLPTELAERLTYVGVACCLEEDPAGRSVVERSRPSGPAHVFVTAGGGADGAALLEPAVKALVSAGAEGAMRATVVTGPFVDPQVRDRIAECVRAHAHIEMLESTAGLHDRLIEADLVVCMGGYNTIYEALCMRRRVLALPRSHPRREQIERVERLERLGLVSVLDADEALDPTRMLARIRTELARPAPDARAAGLRFDGAVEAARLLAGPHRLRSRSLAPHDLELPQERSA